MNAAQVRIILDGAVVPEEDIDGAVGARISYDMNSDDGLLSTAFSNTLIFSGATYTYVIDKLINSPSALTNSIKIEVFATCCTAADGSPLCLFNGLINRGDIAFCEDSLGACSVEVSAIDNSQASKNINCIRNTIIHAKERDGIVSLGVNEGRYMRAVGYYDEVRPYSSAYSALFFGLYLVIISSTITAVIGTIGAIVNFITGNQNLPTFRDLRQQLLGLFLKKRYHIAPFMNSYLLNACKLCGLQLRSPLFDIGGAYYDMLRLDAAYQEGGRTPGRARIIWEEFNRPNITFSQLFESFRGLNLGYAVTDTELIFDRIDRLQSQQWINFSGREVISQCYEPNSDSQPAGEVFSFTNDESDKIGSEFNRLWGGEIVDYNTPFSPILRGIKQTLIPYGVARFVSDTGESATMDISNTVLYSLAAAGDILIEKDLMLMSSGTCSVPKLLMWNGSAIGADPITDARIMRRPTQGGLHNYSIPTWLNQNTLGSFGVSGFYDNLLRVSDPRLGLKKSLNYTLRFRYNCSDLISLGYGKFVTLVRGGQPVTATVETVELDLDLGEMTITGKI